MPYTLVPLTRDFIPSLGEPRQQVLWVGCSDSDFEETTVLDLLPDEIITLRNIGNMFLEGGITCLSMVQYAVEVLHVQHIIVCGHYGCNLVRADSNAGLGDPWRSKLNTVRYACENKLDELPEELRDGRFVELNVLAQMLFLRSYPEVASAVESRGLKIHGVVYDRSRKGAVRLNADLERHDQ